VRATRLTPGSVFADKYEVQRLLGKGSMGAVYLVVERPTGEKRALKLLFAGAAADARATERFSRESSVAGEIASPHVVKVLAAGTAERTPWLVMEYVEGKDLAAFLRENEPAPPEALRAVLAQLFSAVSAAHAASVVHRDLKPENIFITGDLRAPFVKVLDFGVAKRLGMSPHNSTATGLGTPLWTAPEQSNRARGLTPAADVWALGLLAFFVLTRRIYWLHVKESSSLHELLIEISTKELPPASARAKDLGWEGRLPAGFDAWFARCVVRDPAARFPDAGQAKAALEKVLAPRRRTALWIGVGVVTAAASIAVAAALAGR
jgi:serine/threonine protein kinase